MWTWIIATISLCLAFLLILVISIYKKRKSLALLSLIPLALSLVTGSISLYFILKTTYTKVSGKVEKAMEPRTGETIYTSLFGKSTNTCSKVINSKDAILPVIDCCVWIEFTTCPEEAARILAQHNYQFTKMNREGIRFAEPGIAEKPNWFAPVSLGDSALVYKINLPKEKRESLLFLSTDSSRAFFCDIKF
ncbi:hypothetical protein [Flavihumibacter sp. UBA7668]|uniref:hypothetical protein n=1 Tax=Flavihumibacter sp. UBA7668 TaxID=1946542 RepID=UPI0025C11313|nr:hypothetical protein [Flavihumibacter sp. UBA7668]